MEIAKTVKQRGFTLIEAVVALGLATLAYLFFFRIVTLFLQIRGKHIARQDVLTTTEVVLTRFYDMAQGGEKLEVAGNGSELRVTGSPCALIRYDSANKSIGYAEDTSPSCIVPTNTSTSLTTPPVQITTFTLTAIPDPSDAKSVHLSMTVYSQRPFAEDAQSFSSAITLWRK